jgi:hypothetical protein
MGLHGAAANAILHDRNLAHRLPSILLVEAGLDQLELFRPRTQEKFGNIISFAYSKTSRHNRKHFSGAVRVQS